MYLLTRLALLDRLPYFIDEGTHAQFAVRGAHSVKDLFVSLTIGKEPLLIWVGIGFIKAGFAPLAALRLGSLISGLALIWVMTALGAQISSRAVGLAAVALCVLVPFFLVHDVIGIMEPLLTLLLMAALYLQIGLARAPSLRRGAALGVVLGLALLTKESGQIAAALLPVSLLCFDWKAPDRRRRLGTWLAAAAVAVAVTVAADLLLRSSSYYDVAAAVRRNSFLYPVRSWQSALAHPLTWLRLAWPIYRDALSGYVGLPLLLAAAAGVALLWRRDRQVTLVLIAWFVAMCSAAVLFPVSPYPRHILYVVPILSLFAAQAVVEATQAAQRMTSGKRIASAAVGVGVVVMLAIPLLLDARVLAHPVTAEYPGRDDVQYVTGPQAGSPWPAVVAALRRRSHGRPTIIARDASDSDVVQLLLRDSSRYAFVDGSTAAARRAEFVLKDELPFPDPQADRLIRDGGFRLVARLPRPRGGAVVLLFERT